MNASNKVMARLTELGLGLPDPVTPLGSYVSGVRTGDLMFFSGHGPLRVNGKPAFQGHVGTDFSAERAGVILVGATLNVLSSGRRLIGDLDKIASIVEAHAIISCAVRRVVDVEAAAAPAFGLLSRLFGAVGSQQITSVTSLPNGVPVLMEVVAELRD